MSNEVRVLLGRAITRLLVGDRQEFYKLAVEAEEKYRKDRHLYVTVREILDAKRAGVDTIGMGRDRRTVDDSDYRKICLCRTHHTEAHTIGRDSFEQKYQVYGVMWES